MSDWTKALNEALLNRGDKIPAGWITFAQVCKKLDRCKGTTLKLLDVMAKAGRVEVKKFRVVIGGNPRPVKHYRLR